LKAHVIAIATSFIASFHIVVLYVTSPNLQQWVFTVVAFSVKATGNNH